VIKSAISDLSFLNPWKHMLVHASAMAIEGGENSKKTLWKSYQRPIGSCRVGQESRWRLLTEISRWSIFNSE
jgi:hypothetical protein